MSNQLEMRIQSREHAMIAVYMSLLIGQSIDSILEDNAFISSVSEFLPRLNLGETMTPVAKHAIERQETFALALNQHLRKWRFERLNFVEQAILLIACAEFELGVNDRVIVMNEAVRLAKAYGDEDAYKYINGVLDAI